MGNSSKRDAATVKFREETMRQALELRKAGSSYDHISEALELSGRGHAYAVVQKAMKEIIREPAEEVLAMELERLDGLLLSHWPDRNNPRCAAIILQILDRRARYLGLDAPKRTEITGKDGAALMPSDLSSMTDEELAELERTLQSQPR